MSKLKFSSQPVIPSFPVGDEEFGYLWLTKLYDLTVPEHEYIKAKKKELGVKEQLEQAIDFAEILIKRNNEKEDCLTHKDLKSIAIQVAAIDPDTEDLKQELARVKKATEKLLTAPPEMQVEEVVSRLLQEDQALILSNYYQVVQWTGEREEKEKLLAKIMATAMIKFRHVEDPNTFDLEDLEKEIKEGNIHHKVISALAAFADNERSNWKKQTAEGRQAEQDLKKRLIALEKKNQK